jgi:hypothetical protein
MTTQSIPTSAKTCGGSCVSEDSATATAYPTPRKSNQHPARNGRRQPPPRKAKDIKREYELLQSQTLLLAGTASLSFVLFLLFTLPFPALIGLTVMVTSLGACLLVAYAAVKTRYRIELEHPLGLVRYLPETLRAYLTETSLHDCLTPSGSTDSLVSLAKSNHSSKDSLSSCNYPSKGSLPSLQEHHNLEGATKKMR